ncbi:hypothetical protein HGRIS_011494 [Hohenbuehelia grisea]|uniref:Transcription factor IIIC putative zinc-finger domain-containing protein n=1 Tax=Hohenbuehelia grisea TaxID=104357 RepID=A0ABR3JW89_9AGAR
MAILSSNMDLTIWVSGKNLLAGEWSMIQNVTASFLDAEQDSDSFIPVAHILQAQVTSIAWTNRPDLGIEPLPACDHSLFIAGTRAGSCIIMRHESSSMEVIERLQIADSWITHVAISRWVNTGLGQCFAFLVATAANGRILAGKLKLTLTPGNNTASTDFEPLPDISSDIKGSATGVHWVNSVSKDPILVCCTPGHVHLWRHSEDNDGWSGLRTLTLHTQRLCVSSTAFSTPSGIQHLASLDAVCISLSDGSFYTVHSISKDPSLIPPAGCDGFSSEAMSAGARSVSIQCASGGVQFKDMCRVSGMTTYGYASFAWIYESCCLSDFSYKHDSKQNITLVVANLRDELNDENFLQALTEVLSSTNAVTAEAPLALLRPSLLRLMRHDSINRLFPRIVEILQSPITDNPSFAIGLFSGALNAEARLQFRRSLEQHLFGWSSILWRRLRLIVADLIWNLSPADAQRQEECGMVAKNLLVAISEHILQVIIRHLAAFSSLLSAADIPFVLRIATQTMLPDYPPELHAESQALMIQLSTMGLYDLSTPLSPQSLDERCPACGAEVPFNDISQAQCANGHVWKRCSITSFLLATTAIRTCICCTRKALLPSALSESSHAGLCIGGNSWVVQELIEAVRRCLFCGNSFVTVV